MTAAVTMALNAGLQAHRAGDLAKAVAVYGAVLEIEPEHPKARHLRGFALLQADHSDAALADLEVALRSAPDNGTAWIHLAVCLHRLDRPARLAAHRALILIPGGKEALDVLAQDRTASPRVLAWLTTLAPADPSAWTRAGLEKARYAPTPAIRDLRRALCLAPAVPSVWLDLAEVERRKLRPETTLKLIDRALLIRPVDPRAFADRAAAHTELDDVVSAHADTRRAALLDPARTAAWGNRAETLYRQSRYEAALTCGGRARVTDPTDPDVLANLAVYRLACGDLRGGWPLFRQRSAHRNTAGPALPRWSGEAGARLLVLAEQGLGDELLFSTLWRDLDTLVADGRLAAATVETDARLIPLAARTLPRLAWRRRLDAAAPDGSFTHWCLVGDLAERFRPDLASFATAGAGLAPDPIRVSAWQRWLEDAAAGRPAIGLCWRSGSQAGHRRRHYPAIGDCLPLLALPDRFFVVLQYDDCREELESLPLGMGTTIAFPPDLDRRDDQDGVAALMAALDLVVSADTAVAALAGALRVPAVGFSLHRGWVGLGRDQHPWFPETRRVYRAPEMPWRDAMAEVAQAVEQATSDRT